MLEISVSFLLALRIDGGGTIGYDASLAAVVQHGVAFGWGTYPTALDTIGTRALTSSELTTILRRIQYTVTTRDAFRCEGGRP